MRIPYVGITDIETPGQAARMLDVFDKARKKFKDTVKRKLMVGIMMSYKTLNGIPSRWSSVWVPKEKIKKVFLKHPLALNTLHYADYNQDTRVYDILKAVEYGGKNMHALQLDMAWPSSYFIQELKREYPRIQIVLQVGRVSLEKIKNNPDQLVRKLFYDYSGLVDFVLLDKSMGHGLALDPKVMSVFMKAIIDSGINIDIAVAGGLGPKSVHLLKPLVEIYPQLSIDAQGQLRPSGNSMDPVDWKMAEEYLEKAVEIFSGIKKTMKGGIK